MGGFVLLLLHMSLINGHARLFFLGILCHPARLSNYHTCTFIIASTFLDFSTCSE